MANENQWQGGAGRTASANASSRSGSVQDTAQIVKDKAGALYDEAKHSAQSRLNEQKDAAAGGIDEMAGALRDAGRRRDQGDTHGGLSNLTDSAADGLEQMSRTIRSKDIGTMMRDVESFARSQPIAFFGLAAAAGFLAVRFLKASEPSGSASAYPPRLGRSYREDA